MRKLALAVAIAVAGTSATAYAGPTLYNSQAAYLAAVGATGVDTFDNLSNAGPTATPITRTAGAFGYSAATPNDFYGAGSGGDYWLSTNVATDTITFNNFTGGVVGFGGLFFGSDINGLFKAGGVTVSATDATGTTTFTINNATTSSFIGFVSSGPMLSATVFAVQPTSGYLWPTVNNLTLAGAATSGVPEPATWAMLFLGFGGMGYTLRRGRKTRARIRFA